MKKIQLVIYLVFASLLASAQSWNPYVNQGIISQLLPEEFGGSGEASFNIGNTGSSALEYNHRDPDAMTVAIVLLNGVPDRNNPLTSLHGSWVSMFRWSYDESTSTFTGVQKRTIPGYAHGTIRVGYKVIDNSSLSVASNGFSVHLQAPGYASRSNTTQDDDVSSYTFTGAYDFGDAPRSYGIAKHKIDVIRDPSSGLYTRYVVLGSIVDQESRTRFSAKADGDDKQENDDEDGVTFPELKVGTVVTIPVSATVYDASYGLLNAWFDWNGDGDFTDVGEKVTGTPLAIFASGVYNLTVNIPENAITSHPTYARFRIGDNSDAISENAWGEVEDYEVRIQGTDPKWDTEGLVLSGDREEKDVVLAWETLSEYNTTLFRIERSLDGEAFRQIGQDILAAGNSISKLSYGFTDFDVVNKRVSYRIRLFDAAAKELLSNTIVLKKNNSLEHIDTMDFVNVTVYPNPVIDIYYATIDTEGSYQLDLLDLFGRPVSSTSLEVLSGDMGVAKLSRGDLAIGQYYLRVTNKKNGKFQTVKILMVE